MQRVMVSGVGGCCEWSIRPETRCADSPIVAMRVMNWRVRQTWNAIPRTPFWLVDRDIIESLGINRKKQ